MGALQNRATDGRRPHTPEVPKSCPGDGINPIPAAAGFNLRWLIRWLVAFSAVEIIRRSTAVEAELTVYPLKSHAGGCVAEGSGSTNGGGDL